MAASKTKSKRGAKRASDNGHFIGFPDPIYDWLKARLKARGARSIPAVVLDIVRDRYLTEQQQRESQPAPQPTIH